jgi:DNA-binding NarL/FixJ family response regulator
VIDDNEEDLARIQGFLALQRDFTVAGTGKDGYDALRLAQDRKPDLIVSELNLKYLRGVDMGLLLRRVSPSTKTMIFTRSEDERMVLESLCGGAAGYLVKGRDWEVLPRGIRFVYSGGYFFNSVTACAAVRLLVEMIHGEGGEGRGEDGEGDVIPPNMSKPELQVMGFLADGFTNREIAGLLRLKVGTVRNRISSALQKAGLQERTQIALLALRHGLSGRVI